ncbi:MAG: MFS transporter [Actinobacteria bacterium]|nr:MFS transporter [Actinomycetota bacterium]MCB8998321.1 MFS transporter [Actinomycetota bacterium]MCB9415644.1 MFS transporter [Actinomycetota bacterium]HRY10958.1 MFS transporter [Candidatus Nanopelagicales bacterium]
MPASLKRLLAGLAFSALGNGLTIPLLIVYLHDIRGIPTTTAGLVVAWVAGLQFLLTPAIGWWIDRVGPRPVLMQGLLIEASGVACFPLISDVGTAFLLTGLYALGAAHLWPSQTALIARLVDGPGRQRAYGVQFMLLNLGIGLGGLVSAVIVNESDPGSFVLLYRLDALTYLVYFAAAATLVGLGGRLPPAERTAEGGYREVLRDRRLVTLMGFTFVTAGCGWGAQEVGLPILVTQQAGLSVKWLAIAYACNTAVIVAAQLFVINRVEGRSRTNVLAIVGAVYAGSWLVAGVATFVPPVTAGVLFCAGLAVFAIGETMWSPVSPGLLNDISPEHLRGRYNAMGTGAFGLAGVAGPAFSALVLGHGHVGIWIVVTVLGCLSGSALILTLRGKLTPAEDGREPEVAPAV